MKGWREVQGEEGGTGWGGGRYGVGRREVWDGEEGGTGWGGGTKEVEYGQNVLCTFRKLSEN